MIRDVYVHFRVEVREIVQTMSRLLLAIERGDAPADVVAQLFRNAHTLKGAARIVGQTMIAEIAHIMEDALAAHQRLGAPIPLQEAGELLRLVDRIGDELTTLAPVEAAPGSAAEDQLETVRIDLVELDEITQELVEVGIRVAGLRASIAPLEGAEALAASLLADLPEDSARAMRGLARARMNAADLRAAVGRARRDVAARLDAFETELRRIKDHVEGLRLVPAGAIFPLLERAERDAAQSLDRSARFEASGGDIRLDRHVLSAVKDALIHMVRNAVDHGIEPREARSAASKPERGRISLRVERRGSRVAFACEDDGRGIDPRIVRRTAVERGLISEEQAGALTDPEALRLVLRPGFSTAEEVTELSGRGMGLDVARSMAARFKGDIAVSSRRGAGTTFELSVPASLTSITTLAVQAGSAVALVPLDAVVATRRVPDGELMRSPDGATMLYEGESIPFVPLAGVLEQRGHRAPDRAWAVVLLRSGERMVALGAEHLRETSEVVIQPIPPGIEAAPWVVGAALDHEGVPILLVDPGGLLRSLGSAGSGRGEAVGVRPRLPILLIDDSLTTRMLEQSILSSAGYQIDLACSAEEGLEKASAKRYGLFIVDVEMPGMNGFDFTARTRADATLNGIPVILVTSLGSAADKRRGAEAGASAYIVKGEFDQREFLRRVGELLG
jgi:two-component system chemotaxis sensor kinase CheA